MADQPDNLILQYLRRFDERLDRIAGDLRDLKVRMTGVEEGLAGVHRRLDRMDDRLARVECRLDLVEPSPR